MESSHLASRTTLAEANVEAESKQSTNIDTSQSSISSVPITGQSSNLPSNPMDIDADLVEPIESAFSNSNSNPRPQSAFLHFLSTHRAKMKAAFPELAYGREATNMPNFPPYLPASNVPRGSAPFSEVARLLGWEWRRMTPEQKEPYEEKAREDKQRFRRAKEIGSKKTNTNDG